MFKLKRILALVVVASLVMSVVPFALAQDVEKININKATVAELMKLANVGQKYAERIVAFREKNGPFKTPEDLMKVKGIGAKTFEKIKGKITVK
jgi:competence protein ComEA